MSYEFNENYGKRAYIKLHDIEKNLYRKNLCNIGAESNKCSYFRIISNDENIVKECNIIASKNTGSVKMCINNCTNIENVIIEIKCNNVVIYYGKLMNLDIDVSYLLQNNVCVKISNIDKINVDITLAFCGVGISKVKGVGVDSLEGVLYMATNGFDETLLMTYDQDTIVIPTTYSSIKRLPIDYMDIKRIYDKNLFGVEPKIVVIGKDEFGKLLMYLSSDNFTESVTITHDFDEAKIVCINETMGIYFVKNSKLYFAHFNEDFDVLIHEVLLKNVGAITNIYTANVSSYGCNFSAIQTKDSKIYLMYHKFDSVDNLIQNEKVTYRYIDKADKLFISYIDGKTNLYIVHNMTTTKFVLDFDLSNNKISVVYDSIVCPCEGVMDLSLGTIKFFKNFITVEKL